MDIYEKILEEIEERRYVIHHGDEKEFEYLKKDGYAIEVVNETGNEEDSLFIEYFEGKYALFFAGTFETYIPEYEEDVYVLLKDISDILNSRKCAVSLFYNTDDFPKCMASGFMKAKDVKGKSIDEVFRYVFMSKTLKDKIDINGGRADYRFFDTSKNESILIDKKNRS
ncbi:MAG: hypothetical protein II153_06565 [Erysipelotrichaceae bacterium]|nr:hypothetical protein [Erysipelotrichaceae bacterium]